MAVIRRIDLCGKVFGRLTVASFAHTLNRNAYWNCQCSCGNYVVVSARQLTYLKNPTRSCGCYNHDIIFKHGHTPKGKASRTYKSWQSMRQRCSNKNAPDYAHYGGRGISVCDRWNNSFEAFLSDMGERPMGKSIDKINNNGNYEPGNCKWSTAKEQRANQRPRQDNKITVQAEA